MESKVFTATHIVFDHMGRKYYARPTRVQDGVGAKTFETLPDGENIQRKQAACAAFLMVARFNGGFSVFELQEPFGITLS